jgi:hypothetical protein
MEHFDADVIDLIGNYVYRLIDPRNGETFYVGRGVGNRVFSHAQGVTLIDTEDDDEDWKDEVNLKIKRIRDIKACNLAVLHIIHRHGMDKDTAKTVEAALIDAYPGLTNIMGGEGSNDYGPMSASQLQDKYKAVEFDPPRTNNYLLININGSVSEVEIYDAVRYAWKLNIKRAKKADYIIAESRGIVRGIFTADDWFNANEEVFKGFPGHGLDSMNKRSGFVGKPADDMRQYLNTRTPPREKGASFPVRYFYFKETQCSNLTPNLVGDVDPENVRNISTANEKCYFCHKRKATTYKEILDTWKSPFLPIKKPACKICAAKPQEWMT